MLTEKAAASETLLGAYLWLIEKCGRERNPGLLLHTALKLKCTHGPVCELLLWLKRPFIFVFLKVVDLPTICWSS